MIRQLARWYSETITTDPDNPGTTPDGDALERLGVERIWTLHPEQLLRFAEEAWAYRQNPGGRPDLGLPPQMLNGGWTGLQSGIAFDGIAVSALSTVHDSIYRTPVASNGTNDPTVLGVLEADWDHLIYAYLIENTRAVEIFRRVLVEYLHGEKLEVPSAKTPRGLRATVALVFRHLPSGSIGAITSGVRPDAGAVRRNAYHRFFGMDLNHGLDDGRAYPYLHATAANTSFVPIFEDFLREVWIAAENFRNSSGSNPKDDAAIATFARDLRDMLRTRRLAGNLAREEFWIVFTMSWFDATLRSDNAVIADLKSTAGSPEERLRKVGERVGLRPHVHSESFFSLAPRLSTLLKRIEAGDFNSPSHVGVLYAEPTSGPPNPVRKDMLDIINQWSIATGRDMKARRTMVTARTATATRRPLVASGNGVLRRTE